MIDLQLKLHERTVLDSIVAASAQGLSFSEYVEWRLNVDLDTAIEAEKAGGEIDQTVEDVAKELFRVALDQVAEESDEDIAIKGTLYLVEELYKQLPTRNAWNRRERGNRIMIGKAFKRLVDAQLSGGTQIEDGHQVKVIFDSRTAQNQARYKTIRVG